MKKVLKSGLCFLLCLVMFVSGLVSSSVSVYADSSDRIKAFIKLAADGSLTDGSLDGLTEDQLRFLGVYLSNFYVPFVSEITDNSNSEVYDEVKSEMVSALKNTVAFSDDFAEKCVDVIAGCSISSLNNLGLYVKNGNDYVEVKTIPVNYYNFSRIMFGCSYDVLNMLLGSNYGNYPGQEVFPNEGGIAFEIFDKNNNCIYVNKYGSSTGLEIKSLDDIDDISDGTKDLLARNLNYMAMVLYGKSYNGSDGSEYYKVGPDDGSDYNKEGNCNPFSQLTEAEAKQCLLTYQIKCGRYDKFYFCYKDENDKAIPVCDATIGLTVPKDSDKNDMVSFEKPNIIGGAFQPSGDGFGGNKPNSIPVNFEDYHDDQNSYYCKYTPSQVAYIKALETTDLSSGYGFSFFDLNDDEFKNSDFKELDGKSHYDDLYKMSCLGASISVDCFGNIIYTGANHRIVIVPGCLNPYSWVSVDSDGKDKDGNNVGVNYNILNSITINNLIEDNMYSYLKKNGSELSITPKFGIFNSKMEVGDTSADFRKTFLTKIYRGIDIGKFDDDGVSVGGGKNIIDFVQSATYGFVLDRSLLESESSKKEYDPWTDGKPTGGDEKLAKGGITVQRTHDGHNWFGWAAPSFGIKEDSSCDLYINLPNTNDTKMKIYSKIVFIDNLGTYKNEDGSIKDYSAFNVESFLDENGKIPSSNNVIKSTYNSGSLIVDLDNGTYLMPNTVLSPQAASTLYVTYCFACLYEDNNKKDTIGKLGYRFNLEGMPKMDSGSVDIESILQEGQADMELQSIKDWIYYILHPTEGFQYVTLWIKNKVNHLLLGWHNDIVGTNGVGVNVGTTKYKSNMGYVTMPDLSEIQWTNSLINFYNDCIPFLIIILIVVMVFAFVTKSIGFQQALIGVLLFSICSLLPVNLINATVQESNRITQNIYGDKFTYWALVQQEYYAEAIDNAANESGSEGNSSYSNYLRTLYASNEAVYSNQGSDSITLKWQAPKKMASLVLTKEDTNSVNGLGDLGSQMLSNMLNNAYGGQDFIDNGEANYLYRSYTDISNFSRYIYRGIAKGKRDEYNVSHASVLGGSSLNSANAARVIREDDMSGWDDYDNAKEMYITNDGYKNYIDEGYTSVGLDSSGSNITEIGKTFYMTVPLSSNIINDLLKDVKNNPISSYIDSSDNIRMNQDVFNFGLPMFQGGLGDNPFSSENFIATGMIEDATRKTNLENFMKNGSNSYVDSDYVGLAAFGLYSESPYYYFSWKLYSDGMNYDSSLSDKNFKSIILRKDGDYFYNTKGNGELKDFMNMKGLFTLIIPYMRQCNDIVREWDDVFGVFTYEGVPTEEGHWDEVKNDPELAQKYWHNLNVARLYDIYCPWVDVMYDCSYAKPENITVLGKTVTISDPINPYSYPEDRPMIFSRSEMADYGLSEADLTKVEKLILQCNDMYQDRLYELLNYYNFSDVSLNSAAAINCAFVFNNTFSESGIFSDNHNIYPQSFDIANFSYDAFLRLALANSTGEDLLNDESVANTYAGTTTGDFYERLVNNSSIVTVLVMLILDVVSVFVIPAVRIFFIIALFVAVILLILVAALKIEENMKFVRKILSRFFVPLILFFVTTVGFAFILSFFMGVGSNEVTKTGNNFNISLGDPVMTMLIMLLLNVLLIVLYWKIIKGVLKDLKQSASKIKSFGKGLGSAAIGFVGGVATASLSSANKFRSEMNEFGRDLRSRKDSKNLKKSAENTSSDEPAQNGTGVENSRASQRGANDSRGNSEESRHAERGNTSNERLGSKKGKSAEDSEKKKSEINKKALTGSEKMQHDFDMKRMERTVRDNRTVVRDFGYAQGSKVPGDIDKSKLSARDRYKYENRMKRINNRESGLRKNEEAKVNNERRKEEIRGRLKNNASNSSKKSNKK